MFYELLLVNSAGDKFILSLLTFKSCFVGLEGLPAAELELVVLCKLQQAAIAGQKHHSAMAARIVMSALKLLKSSLLFKKKKEPPAPPR